jgi:hypothetical protein
MPPDGGRLDDQNPRDTSYAPVVAQHFSAGAPQAPVAAEAPGQVGREFVLSVAEGVKTLLGSLVPGTTA